MFQRLAMIGLLLILGTARADDKPKERPETNKKSDQDLFQGTWKAEKAVKGGQEGPADEVGRMTIEFKGNKAMPRHGDRGEKEAEFKLDSSKKPKEIDVSTPEGKQVKGIYEIDGDTLKLCFVEDGDRPTKFESADGSKSMFLVLKRQKK